MDPKIKYKIIFDHTQEEWAANSTIEPNIFEAMEDVRKLQQIVQEIDEEQEPLTYTRT